MSAPQLNIVKANAVEAIVEVARNILPAMILGIKVKTSARKRSGIASIPTKKNINYKTTSKSIIRIEPLVLKGFFISAPTAARNSICPLRETLSPVMSVALSTA